MAARRQFWRWCLALAVVLLLAGAFVCWERDHCPDGGDHEVPLVVFALDSSCSMLAPFGDGTRLSRAQAFVSRVAEAAPYAELALVTFGGDAMLDFPPSLDREGFLNALADIRPTLSFSPGSDPGAGLVLAQTLCHGRQALVALVTDGEFQVADEGALAVWAERSARLVWCVVGLGEPMPMPLGGSWLRDPDTGEVALSKADDGPLRQLCGLSGVDAVSVQPDADVQGIRAILEPMLATDASVAGGASAGLPFAGLACAVVACALLLSALAVDNLPGRKTRRDSRNSEHLWGRGWLVFALAVLPLGNAQGGEEGGRASSVAYLTNRAADAIDAALKAGGGVSALEHIQRGLMLCREALRCADGEAPAETVENLQILLSLQKSCVERGEGSENATVAASAPSENAGDSRNGGDQTAHRSNEGGAHGDEGAQRDDAPLPASDMDDALGLAGDAAPSRQVSAEVEKMRRTGGAVGRASDTGSWRQVVVKERPLRGRVGGAKPW